MIKRIVAVIIGILVILLGRGFYYYSGFYSAPPIEMPSFEHAVLPMQPSTEYSDTYEKGEGTILLDLAHDNAFELDELGVPLSRLAARGLTIDFLAKEEKEAGAEEGLEGELKGMNAFITVCPKEKFSKEEKETIRNFVEDGGKLLLVADPTRVSEINSLSLDFGLIFEPDYLYDMKENDANFRNIFITEFKENEITKDLEKIALYTAGSITSSDYGIAFVGGNTFSSLIETRRKLSPIALTMDSKVLAVYDFTFMTEPYNGILDNNKLISNIADWLASPTKKAESK
jgi:hypothetical protein